MSEKTDSINLIQRGIAAVQQEEYLLALTLLDEAYAGPVEKRAADGLSYYGLCLALIRKKFKPAIEFCQKALELQFYQGDHYLNMAKVYIAAGNKKKAIETIEKGLRVVAGYEPLIELRKELGIRARPPLPFLGRENPLNVVIGQARHSKKSGTAGPKKTVTKRSVPKKSVPKK